jgi:transcription initiation factor TFIID subunit 8
MAPSSPVSRKRSLSSQYDEQLADGPADKRQRVDPSLPSPPPEELLQLNLSNGALFDEKPRKLLTRAVALALEYVGFDGASSEALEAMCTEAETCQYPYLLWLIIF